jgi:hypothetical protein
MKLRSLGGFAGGVAVFTISAVGCTSQATTQELPAQSSKERTVADVSRELESQGFSEAEPAKSMGSERHVTVTKYAHLDGRSASMIRDEVSLDEGAMIFDAEKHPITRLASEKPSQSTLKPQRQDCRTALWTDWWWFGYTINTVSCDGDDGRWCTLAYYFYDPAGVSPISYCENTVCECVP